MAHPAGNLYRYLCNEGDGMKRRIRFGRVALLVLVVTAACLGMKQMFAPSGAGEAEIPDVLQKAAEKNPELKTFAQEYPDKKDQDLQGIPAEYREGVVPQYLQWDERWGYTSGAQRMRTYGRIDGRFVSAIGWDADPECRCPLQRTERVLCRRCRQQLVIDRRRTSTAGCPRTDRFAGGRVHGTGDRTRRGDPVFRRSWHLYRQRALHPAVRVCTGGRLPRT